MHRLLAFCGGFLLAVLWMDLMFDVQVSGHDTGPLPEQVLASIAHYYARVTTNAAPMNRFIAGVMLVMVAGIAIQLRRGRFALWLRVVVAISAAVPVILARVRIVPNAVELGSRSGSLEHQSELAHSIFVDHVLCAVLVLFFVVCQLSVGHDPHDPPRESAV